MDQQNKTYRLPEPHDPGPDDPEPQAPLALPAAECPVAIPAPEVRGRYSRAAVCGLLLLAVALVFGETVRYGFVDYDDGKNVYENPIVKRGVTSEGLLWAFTTRWNNMSYPLTWISYMLDSQMYGVKPWGYHLTNVLLHAATSVILFLTLQKMTGNLWASALATLLFAVHPLRAESVAWVSDRKSPLSGLFFVLTIAAYAAYARRPFSLARYLLVAGLFALSLTAKPNLVTLPFLLLLLDFWPLRRQGAGSREQGTESRGRVGEAGEAASDGALREPVENEIASSQGFDPRRNPPSSPGFAPRTLPAAPVWRLVVEKIPLFAISAAGSVAAVLSQTGNIASLESMPMGTRIENAVISYTVYLREFFWPAGLAALYPAAESFPRWQVAAAAAVLAAVSAAALALWRKQPAVLVGWLWYLGALVPMIGLVQIGSHARADRYTYLPQIGLNIAVVWGISWGIDRLWRDGPARRWFYSLAGGLLLGGLAVCAWQQASSWRTDEQLWTRAVACTSNNSTAHNCLGVALAARGAIDEAIVQYRKALEIKPDYVEAHTNLGQAFAARGEANEAMAEYRKALQIKPDDVGTLVNFGLALAGRGEVAEAIVQYRKAPENDPDSAIVHNNLGFALASQGQVVEAIPHFQQALKIDADYADAHNNLGSALAARGQIAEASAEYQKALEINPESVQAHDNLGNVLAARGEVDEALAHYRRALEIAPGYFPAHFFLAKTLAGRGQVDEAIAHYQKALQLAPNFVAAHLNLGVALAGRGQADEAIAHYRKVLEIVPNYAEAHNDLGGALAGRGRVDEALFHFRRAVEIKPDYVEAHTNLGDVLANRGEIQAALEHYQTALDLATARNHRALAELIRARIKRCQAAVPVGNRP